MTILLLLAKILISAFALPVSPRTAGPFTYIVHATTRATQIGIPVGAAMTPDGGLVIADLAEQAVLKFDSNGRLTWKRGRKGGGPGEFTLLYRIAVTAKGEIAAYDKATSTLTYLTADGTFIKRNRLPFSFYQVDRLDFVADTLILVGVTGWGASAMGKAIHLFRGDLSHIRSFGPLPAPAEDWVLQQWGAGGITVTDQSEVLYSRRLPYEIYRFTAQGRQLQMIPGAIPIKETPSDALVRTEGDGGRIAYSRSTKDVPLPITAVQVGNFVLGGRATQTTVAWDYYTRDGQYVGSETPPADWQFPVGYDSTRKRMWIYATSDLEPVYVLVDVIEKK